MGIKKINNDWLDWLNESELNGLNKDMISGAIREIANKMNEIINELNKKK